MKPQATDDCRTVLKRVGVALIVFGAIDIGVMMYCIAHQISYSSSFNLFAVISGIYLWRGHPWYVESKYFGQSHPLRELPGDFDAYVGRRVR